MKKLFIVIAGLVLAVNTAWGQEEDSGETDVQGGSNLYNVGQTSPSLYTGGIGFSVPVYTISDPDFKLPISLVYTANGFMPEQFSGSYGMNWDLSIGASLTRKIVDKVDEWPGKLSALREGRIFPDKDSVFEWGDIRLQRPAPDIFSFNVNGQSGDFFIDNDGEIKIIAGDYCSVDISDFYMGGVVEITRFDPISGEPHIEIRSNYNLDRYHNIKIVDKQGYTYVFGGQDSTITDIDPRYHNGTTQEWKLTKIVAPNGRILNLEYEVYVSVFENIKLDVNTYFKFLSETISAFTKNNETEYDSICVALNSYRNYIGVTSPEVIPGAIVGWYNLGPFIKSSLKTIRIDDIGFELSLNYENDNIPAISSISSNIKNIKLLQSIDLKIGNNLTKTMSLDYQVFTATYNKYYYLKTINTFMGTQYTFTYNENIPSLNSSEYLQMMLVKRDDYGYYKANPFAGTLTSIINPMGGIINFEYERHNYLKTKMFGYGADGEIGTLIEDANMQDSLYNNIRIKKIIYRNGVNSLVETKEYTYTDNNAQSSGMLHIDFAIKAKRPELAPLYYVRYYIFERSKFGEPYPVTYSQITEKRTYYSTPSNKIYKTVYYFSDYNSMPDIIEANPYIPSNHNDNHYPYNLYRNLYWFSSQSARRGLLVKQEEYEGLSTFIKKTEFEYQPLLSDINVANRNYAVFCFDDYPSHMALNAIKKYFGSANPVKITTTDFINGHSVVNWTEFDYDARNRLKEKRTNGALGKVYFTKYRYADDIVPVLVKGDTTYSIQQLYSGFAGGLQQIQKQGWMSRPVEVINGYKEDGNRYYTNGTVSLFKKENNLLLQQPLPASSTVGLTYYLSHPSPYIPQHASPYATLSSEMVMMLEEPILESSYLPMSLYNNTLIYDSRYEKVADYEYNDKLRLTKLSPANALETTYEWDSDNFYVKSETTGNFTKTFKYMPMIGPLSETDARGVSLNWLYDIYNRPVMSFMYGGGANFKQITVYQYHYYNQP